MQNTLKIVLLSSFIAISYNAHSLDSHLITHTDTPIELKPVSFSKGLKYASVCFLGSGCDVGINEDMTIDTAEMCKKDGYEITSCTPPLFPSNQCPQNPDYYSSCQEDKDRACKELEYFLECEVGKEQDISQTCPYDSNYKKCQCSPCSGFTYSFEEASQDGYTPGASCNSCGTIKYQRNNATCSGFQNCECGGEIGAKTCKSGTNTLFNNCKECIKCNDECPTGFYKEAGDSFTVGREGVPSRKTCTYGEKTSATQCGITCYQCQPPYSTISSSCRSSCPEGYTENENHDYTCKPLTCREKIKSKYPNYFYGGKADNCSDYKFDRSYVSESNTYINDLGDWCYLSPREITHSFYSEVDFDKEFPECKYYCRPYKEEVKNKTFKGNIYLGIGCSYQFTDIVVDGTLTLPWGGRYQRWAGLDKLTLKENATLIFETVSMGSPNRLSNVLLYPGSTIESTDFYAELYDTVIAENSVNKPVTLKNLDMQNNITSSHILAGTSGGLYLNMNYTYYSSLSDMSKYSILRNPGGKININFMEPPSSSHQTYQIDMTLFKNPGIDTIITLSKGTHLGYFSCIILANDSSKKLCSGEKGDAKVTFLTDDFSKHVLPSCCSQDSSCAESSWNNGTMKCEGYSDKK